MFCIVESKTDNSLTREQTNSTRNSNAASLKEKGKEDLAVNQINVKLKGSEC